MSTDRRAALIADIEERAALLDRLIDIIADLAAAARAQHETMAIRIAQLKAAETGHD
jgi:hypothetical protein